MNQAQQQRIEEFLIRHASCLPLHTPRGPYLNPEQPTVYEAPRFFLLHCPCGGEFVYAESEQERKAELERRGF